jgi:hypothetical protein
MEARLEFVVAEPSASSNETSLSPQLTMDLLIIIRAVLDKDTMHDTSAADAHFLERSGDN